MLTSTFGIYIRPMLELHGFNPEAYIPFPSGSGIAFSNSTITFQPIPNNHDPFCPCFTAGRQPHKHIRTLLAGRQHLCSSLSCTLVHWTHAVMQKSLQTSIILVNLRISLFTTVRGKLTSPEMVVNAVSKILDYIHNFSIHYLHLHS